MDLRPSLVVLAGAMAVLLPQVTAQDEEAGCDVHAELFVDIQYFQDGALVASGTGLQGNVAAGRDLTAELTIAEGCFAELSLVAYAVDTPGNLDLATAVSSDAHVLVEGIHSLTVQVPDCGFEVALVAGAIIEAAPNPDVLYQADGRLISYATGGSDCALEGLPDLPCPTDVAVTAQADGGVLLRFQAVTSLVPEGGPGGGLGNATSPEGTAIGILRATPGASFGLLARLPANATSYLDTAVAEGEVYRYAVVLLQGDRVLTPDCPTAEVTAIPDLPTGIAVAAAGVLGTAAYAVMRRRKA